MNTTEMLAVLRRNIMTEDGALDYTDTTLLAELSDALTTKFERPVLDAKANYWIQNYDVSVTSGRNFYRLPTRAIGISKVELGAPNAASNGFARLPQISEDNVNAFQSPPSALGQPNFWLLRGDQVWLFPTPDNSGYTLRIWYYVRPSRLTPTQTTAGQIIAISTAANSVTVFSQPFGYNRDGTQVSTNGTTVALDIIAPGAWRELKVVSALPSSVVSQVYTFPSTVDISDVRIGDWLRMEDNTDWPQIPEDFHRTLIDIASVKILVQRDFQQKAAGYAQDASIDIARFSYLIAQRVQEEPPTYRADLPSLRNYRYWGGGWW